MDENHKITIVLNTKKNCKTESNIKQKNILSIPPIYIKKIHKLNYKLYKFNENNRISNNRNNILHHINEKDLFSNILIRNYRKKSYIRNLYEVNTDSEIIENNKNYLKTLNYFHTQNNSVKNSVKTLQQKLCIILLCATIFCYICKLKLKFKCQ